MADSITIDTGATDRLAASLTDAARRLEDRTDLLTDLAARVASDASRRVPRRTGALAASLSMDRATLEGHPAATLTWGVRYGVFVNFGTRHMRAQPFATDALAAAAGAAEPQLRDWAETIIDRIGT